MPCSSSLRQAPSDTPHKYLKPVKSKKEEAAEARRIEREQRKAEAEEEERHEKLAEELRNAAGENDFTRCSRLLGQGAEPDRGNEMMGTTALMKASMVSAKALNAHRIPRAACAPFDG